MPPRLSGNPKGLLLPFAAPQLITTNVPLRTFGIKSISRPRPNRFNTGPDLPLLKATAEAALQRKLKSLPLRTGAVAIKKGMTALFDPQTGERIPATVLQLDRVQVISHKTIEKHGYYAVQVGCGWKHPSNVAKALLGHFSANTISPKRHVYEFRVRDEKGLLPIGQIINADWFQEGQFVDSRSNSKGKGFQGVMKRWGFAGQDRTHGASLSHRSMGNTAPGQGGGSRVYPGKKMPGNMGNEQNTVQNLKILKTDPETGIVLVSGMLSPPPSPRYSKVQWC